MPLVYHNIIIMILHITKKQCLFGCQYLEEVPLQALVAGDAGWTHNRLGDRAGPSLILTPPVLKKSHLMYAWVC